MVMNLRGLLFISILIVILLHCISIAAYIQVSSIIESLHMQIVEMEELIEDMSKMASYLVDKKALLGYKSVLSHIFKQSFIK